MPKFPGNRKSVRKPLESANSGKNVNEPSAKKKRKSTVNTNDEDSIAVSKQLSIRIQSSRSSRIRTTRSTNKNNDPIICGNGKPMPTLAELEKMYEDSDGEEEPKAAKEIPLSPKSIKNIASRLLDRITKISDPTELIDELPPPPIVPQKKPKKSGIPYIIGCKERTQVIRKPNTSFCKGDDYGVDLNAASDDEGCCPKTRQKRSKKANISKSIFNAKSDEIAERLKENDVDSDGSNDSNKTVAYTYYNRLELSGRPQSFSPLPSTSTDNETFLKNDQCFNECLVSENGNNISQNDVELFDTIVIDDDSFTQPTKKIDDKDSVEFIEPLDKGAFIPTPTEETDSEDIVQIIEPDEVKNSNRKSNNSPIYVDDYYSSIDINETFDDHDVEDINIDDLIQENNYIIGKFADKRNFNVITHIKPNIDKPYLHNKTEGQTNDISIKENTNDPGFIPETFYNSTPPTVNISETPNRPSEPRNRPSETHNRPSENHNHPNDTHNSPSATHNSPHTVQTNPRKKQTSAEKRENMMTSIVRNFFNGGESQKNPQNRVCTVDLTDDNFSSYRKTPKRLFLCDTDKQSLTQLASSLEYDYCFSSIIANLHNLLQKQQTSTAPDQTRCNPDNNSRITKPTTPDEDKPKNSRCFGDCPICMESLGNNEVASTVCGHVFCLKCIQAAIKKSGKKCPTCRKSLRGIGYHQLFL